MTKTPVFWRADTSMIWIIVAIASLWIGAMCFVPGQTMVQITYKKALGVMPQQAWGTVFLIHAIVSAAYLSFCNTRIVGIAGSLIGIAAWLLMLSSMMHTIHSWMPLGGEMAIVFACFFLCIRTLTDE